jgi:hypothetical protein
MHLSKNTIIIIVAVVVAIVIFAIIIAVILLSNGNSDENFVPGDYNRYYISNNGQKKSANTILGELMHNVETLENQISTGSFPNFATVYGVFNNYLEAMEKHSGKRIDKIDELIADTMAYLGYKAPYLKDASSDEWRILQRKLINMKSTFDTIKKNAELFDPKLEYELSLPMSDSNIIKEYFSNSLGSHPNDEYNLADSVVDSLNNMNNTSQLDYADLLSNDSALTSKTYQEHVKSIKSKRNKKYYNEKGERILPNIQTKIITESVDGTVRHDPLGYRGDPRVYSNNLEAAKEVAYNPDVILSIYQPSMRVVQVS